MSVKYLLPCHDGRTVEVTTADAGRTIDCPCGKRVLVTTLRGLRNLPRAPEPETGAAAATWSARQGAMFTSGVCVLLFGLVAVGLLYNRWRKIETAKPEVDAAFLAEMQGVVDSAEPASTLNAWYALNNSPLPEIRQTLEWETNREEAQRYVIYMSIAGAVAAIGLALAIAGPLLPPEFATPRQQRPPVRPAAH